VNECEKQLDEGVAVEENGVVSCELSYLTVWALVVSWEE
jgi:hypothetical protein